MNKFAERLLSLPQLALRYAKLTVNMALRELASSMMDVDLGYESVTNASSEHLEALLHSGRSAGQGLSAGLLVRAEASPCELRCLPRRSCAYSLEEFRETTLNWTINVRRCTFKSRSNQVASL